MQGEYSNQRNGKDDLAKPMITLKQILKVVSDYFNISEELICSKKRDQEIIYARHTAMYLMKELVFRCTFDRIATFFGCSNATVFWACRSVENQMQNNPEYKQVVETLKLTIERKGL